MAEITQETGEDWKDVVVRLSPSEPSKRQFRKKIKALRLSAREVKTKKSYFSYAQSYDKAEQSNVAPGAPKDTKALKDTDEGSNIIFRVSGRVYFKLFK